MQVILLTQDREALVDDEDYLSLNCYEWYLGSKGYAQRNLNEDPNRGTIRMHQQIMGSRPGFQLDHVNGNKCDNRRSNLRFVTLAEQARNVGPRKNNSSGHKGVGWYHKNSKWRAYITFNGQSRTIGYYNTIEEAVEARTKVENELFNQ